VDDRRRLALIAGTLAFMTSDPDEDLDVSRPFTRSQAIASGMKARDLRVVGIRRLHRSVYVAADSADSPRQRTEAALHLFDEGAFASHASAARLWDLPIPTLPDEHISVLKPKHRRANPGVRCHVQRHAEVQVRHGLRVSTPVQLFVELASLLGLVDLVVLGDAMVKKGLVTPEALLEHCSSSRLRGAKAALRAARFVRPRVDSPMESRLRMLLVLAGLPEPEVNLIIRDVDGQPLRRYDLSWPEVKVIVEYDGRHHVEREDQWESDLDRREAIDDSEWRIIVVVAKGIYTHPESPCRKSGRSCAGAGWPAYRPGRRTTGARTSRATADRHAHAHAHVHAHDMSAAPRPVTSVHVHVVARDLTPRAIDNPLSNARARRTVVEHGKGGGLFNECFEDT